MSGSAGGLRRGLTLTMVFVTVLATGAATDAWHSRPQRAGSPHVRVETAATPSPRSGDDASRHGHDRPGRVTRDSKRDLAKLSPKRARALVASSEDPWAAYYSSSHYARFARSLQGRYIGVGVWVRSVSDGLRVSKVQDGSPADRHGVRTGDRLTAVDGHATRHHPVTEVVALLRDGRSGTPVRLDLRRSGEGTRQVTVRRAVLSAQHVVVRRLRAGPSRRASVTSIKVTSFTRGVGRQVRRALRQADAAWRDSPGRGRVLLDLRGNSGGLLREGVRLASAFLDGGVVARYDEGGHDGRPRKLTATHGGATAVPLVVLVDGGTMSAAEMVAGALQERNRAVLVGSRTFGKGSVQAPARLADGSVVERTVGHYRTPSGRPVDGAGVWPDVRVAQGAAKGEVRRRALAVLSGLGSGA